MAELDHIVYLSHDVEQGVAYIHELTGAQAVAGGPHVGRGTHNSLLTFDDRTYFEIIGVDPNQPDPERPRGFGMDDRDTPGLVAFAVHPIGNESVEELAATIAEIGFDPGTIMEMSRQKPDGDLLEWRLSAGGDTGKALNGALPFVIDWLGKPSPATELPSMGDLVSLAITNPDVRIAEAITALGLGDVVSFAEGPASLAATIASTNGTVELL